MFDYQNLFTQVRVDAPSYPGVPLQRERDNRERLPAEPWHVQAAAWLGNAQIGPVYLGFTGIAAVIFFSHWVHRHWLEHAGAGQLQPH